MDIDGIIGGANTKVEQPVTHADPAARDGEGGKEDLYGPWMMVQKRTGCGQKHVAQNAKNIGKVSDGGERVSQLGTGGHVAKGVQGQTPGLDGDKEVCNLRPPDQVCGQVVGQAIQSGPYVSPGVEKGIPLEADASAHSSPGN
ncbi:short-chain dehydrogenase [Sesbania bispinosa]|nr:short-chain dehydrogenase [Sesbania bispinosa]